MRRALLAILVAGAALLSVPPAVGAGAPSGADRPRATPSAGCGEADPVAPGEEQVALAADADRWYLRHVPPGYDGTEPFPLVLDLHGYLEGATIHAIHSGLGAFGDEHGFVTLTPNGTGQPVRWDARVGSSDVRFMEQVLDEAEKTLCVDRRRIYATGLSNGAFMTSVLACDLADRIAAVAPVAGIREVKRCRQERRVPVIAFHGTDDQVVSFDGGLGPAGLNLPAPDGSGRRLGDLGGDLSQGKSIPEVVAVWAKRNGCKREPKEQDLAIDVTHLRYRCPRRADVELYEVIGGGHTWPGSEFSASIGGVVGYTTFSISANALIWEFFSRHPLDG